MDEKTVRALNAINRSFYGASHGASDSASDNASDDASADASDDGRAGAFSETRRSPWPGWTRLPPLLRALRPDGELAVLDVGCGTGDLTRALARARPRPGVVVGLDFAHHMLLEARPRTRGATRWCEGDASWDA